MFRRTVGLVALVTVAGAGVAWVAPLGISGGQTGRPPDPGANEAAARDAYARLPLTFVPNAGQSDDRVRYSTQASGYGFFFTPTEVALAITNADDGGQAGASGQSLALTFLGSDPDATDNGEPGAGQDTFAIQTASGYAASGPLQHGNIQIHS